MRDEQDYFYKKMPDEQFGVDVILRSDLHRGMELRRHWHEHMQLYVVLSGSAVLECEKRKLQITAGDITVINGNELHYLKSLSDNLKIYVVRVDLPFLFSNQVDSCQTKYLAPLSQNRITFSTLIREDEQVAMCVTEVLKEYENHDLGYELAVKSAIYRLIVLLLRHHVEKILTPKEFSAKAYSLKRFDSILETIQTRYAEKITVNELSQSANITVFYFCRIFKQITGKTFTEYLNETRLEKSAEYLMKGDLNITEVALKSGFDSVNYYSRLFRRKHHISPKTFREDHTA